MRKLTQELGRNGIARERSTAVKNHFHRENYAVIMRTGECSPGDKGVNPGAIL